MSVGPPPSRARAIASLAASCTAKKSNPSTMTPGMPNPAARSAMLSLATDQVLGRALGVAIVLGHEDGRQVPHRGQVHRFQRGALVAAAVAEERDADAAVAFELGGQRRPADQR